MAHMISPKANQQTTSISTENQTFGRSSRKRKLDANSDRPPGKRSRDHEASDIHKAPPTDREPRGIRNSGRMAGKAAGPTASPPSGQYARRNAAATSTSQHSETAASSQHIRPLETTPPEQKQSTPVSHSEDTEELQDRMKRFLGVLASTVGMHRVIRRLTNIYNTESQRTIDLRFGEDGIVSLENQLLTKDGEVSAEELESIRNRLAERKRQLGKAKWGVQHAESNNALYDFVDIPRNEGRLSALSTGFWTAYDRCHVAYTACKGIEQDMDTGRQQKRQICQDLGAQITQAVLQGGSSVNEGPTTTGAFRETFVEASTRLRDLNEIAVTMKRLERPLNDAKDRQYREESRLNKILEDDFIAARFLEVENGVQEVELHRQLKPTNNNEQRQDPTAAIVGKPGRSGGKAVMMDAHKRDLASKVKDARARVKNCRHKLNDMRWKDLSDVGSMNSDAQGQERFRRMIRRTREFRTAEADYKAVLHHAQDERAISESGQSSNLRSHSSDGYGASTLKEYGYPMPQKKETRIHRWMAGSSSSKRAITEDAEEGQWVAEVQAMGFGEDVNYTDDSRLRKLIDECDRDRELLREAGPFEKAENDFHPKNSD